MSMTSNDTSSPSLMKKQPPEESWNKLLGEPRKLREVVKVINSREWQAIQGLLNQERWHHLELATESNDTEAREKHRTIAIFIKMFAEALEDAHELESQARHPERKPNIDPNYMEFDSGTNLDPDPINPEG